MIYFALIIVTIISCKENNDPTFVQGSQLDLLKVDTINNIPYIMFTHNIENMYGIITKGEYNDKIKGDTIYHYYQSDSNEYVSEKNVQFSGSEYTTQINDGFIENRQVINCVVYSQDFSYSNKVKDTIIIHITNENGSTYNEVVPIKNNQLYPREYFYNNKGQLIMKKCVNEMVLRACFSDSIITSYSYNDIDELLSVESVNYSRKGLSKNTTHYNKGIPIKEIFRSDSAEHFVIDYRR